MDYSWTRMYPLDIRLPSLILPSEESSFPGQDARRFQALHGAATSLRVETPDPIPESDTFQYKLEVQNPTAVSIRSLVWDYVFKDPYSGEEIGRVRFLSPERIKPGAKKRLQGFTVIPPANVISTAALREGGRISSEFVEIIQIRFSDKSVWQNDEKRIDRVHPLMGTVIPPWWQAR